MEQGDIVRAKIGRKGLDVLRQAAVRRKGVLDRAADVGFEPVGGAQVANQERFVADGVAAAESGDKLVKNHFYFSSGPGAGPLALRVGTAAHQ